MIVCILHFDIREHALLKSRSKSIAKNMQHGGIDFCTIAKIRRAIITKTMLF